MPDQYLSPGVFVKEVSKLGKAIVQVSTSVPAFIGYTEKYLEAPQKVRSMQEFEALFGTVHTFIRMRTNGGVYAPQSAYVHPDYTFYYCIRLYFANGGGPCWIVSVGTYKKEGETQDALDSDLFVSSTQNVLDKLETIDEISILCVPELPMMADPGRATVIQALLANCARRQDRFAILDEYTRSSGNDTLKFREACGNDNLQYGAAYYPQVMYNLEIPDRAIIMEKENETPFQLAIDGLSLDEALKVPEAAALLGSRASFLRSRAKMLVNIYLGAGAAIAAIYGATDEARGVWKAPAGMSIVGVERIIKHYYHLDDSPLMNDVTGKEINGVKETESQGVVVWGARTLAGNDLDYRYVPVRRLMTYIGQTLKKSTAWAIFEPNNANTWLTLSNMCENFLNDLWRQGAFMGAKPKDAYNVNIGLGQSMDSEDILKGILRIEIAVAPVRPAEFIIFSFSHQLQQS